MFVKSSYDIKIKNYGHKIRNSIDYNGHQGMTFGDSFPMKKDAHDPDLIFIGWFDGDNTLITRDYEITFKRPAKGECYYIAKYLQNNTNEIVLDIYHIFALNEGFNKSEPGIIF